MEKDKLATTISNRIREFRQSRGMTQEDLAGAAEKSRVTIYKLEAGRSKPSLATLGILAQALGVSLADLLREDETGTEREAFLRARIQTVTAGMNEAQLEASLKVLEAFRPDNGQ